VFKLAYFLVPKSQGGLWRKVMRTYFDRAPALPPTSGNLFAPAAFGNAVYGGWNSHPWM
jgi:hypothetical protein